MSFTHSQDKKEIILCAAIWYTDVERKSDTSLHPINIDRGVVLCGHRHGHVIAQIGSILALKQFETGENVQGFLTSKNRFVDREEAHKIFILSGGTPEYSDELYSEDLY